MKLYFESYQSHNSCPLPQKYYIRAKNTISQQFQLDIYKNPGGNMEHSSILIIKITDLHSENVFYFLKENFLVDNINKSVIGLFLYNWQVSKFTMWLMVLNSPVWYWLNKIWWKQMLETYIKGTINNYQPVNTFPAAVP